MCNNGCNHKQCTVQHWCIAIIGRATIHITLSDTMVNLRSFRRVVNHQNGENIDFRDRIDQIAPQVTFAMLSVGVTRDLLHVLWVHDIWEIYNMADRRAPWVKVVQYMSRILLYKVKIRGSKNSRSNTTLRLGDLTWPSAVRYWTVGLYCTCPISLIFVAHYIFLYVMYLLCSKGGLWDFSYKTIIELYLNQIGMNCVKFICVLYFVNITVRSY